jgi:hypothetical protein
MLLGGTVMYFSIFNDEAYAQSNTWYVGKGLQPDTYYTLSRISNFENTP